MYADEAVFYYVDQNAAGLAKWTPLCPTARLYYECWKEEFSNCGQMLHILP